jgi:geranylgeranyl pyrophosphate synthase
VSVEPRRIGHQTAKIKVSIMVMQFNEVMFTADIETDSGLLLRAVELAMLKLLKGNFSEAKSYHAPMMQAVTYHLSSGGSRIRARLALETALCLQLSKTDALVLAAASELFHNASLIHDDIQDKDTLRRGVESVWSKFGKNTALCAGDFLLSAAYGALAGFSVQRIMPKLISLAHSRISDAIHGQCEDLAVRSKAMTSFTEYEKIAAAKAGALLGMPLELAFVAADQESWVATAKRAADCLAIGYQIMDDIADVHTDSAQGHRAHSLNAVLALRTGGHGLNAQQIARERALEHLSTAIRLAETLPFGSGAPLRTVAKKLISQP